MSSNSEFQRAIKIYDPKLYFFKVLITLYGVVVKPQVGMIKEHFYANIMKKAVLHTNELIFMSSSLFVIFNKVKTYLRAKIFKFSIFLDYYKLYILNQKP